MEITEPEGDKSANSQIVLGAGLGAGLGLACVVVIVLAVIIVRLRKMISRRHDESPPHQYSEAAPIASVSNDHVYGEIPLREIKSQRSYQNLESLNGEETTPSTAKETEDQDTYHIYEVPKEDENTSDPVQEDFYENKGFS
ncbi:uncharacterized protein LOC112568100 [Pomacea canaliculata]|uniref:uncharacterized protein LOC112568100 n=1 Tax=Pomacea canaliculata TaxID=400727 RepID=UPI000D73CE72|nr:uncharacterized protein LOC112568100 [Pomacea canaliculata]